VASDSQTVAALSHGIDILRCFTSEQPVQTNSALARLTALPRSSISRLTHTLVKAGYLDYDSVRGAYRLGLSVLSLHPAALAGARAECFSPAMEELAQQTGSRVMLTAYESFGLTVVLSACSNSAIPPPERPGFRYDMPRRAMGRACMASIAELERDHIVAHLLQGNQAAEATVRDEVEMATRTYRADGYCTSMGERRPGNHSISAPLNVPHLGRRLFLCCGGPAELLPVRQLRERTAPMLMRSIEELERSSAALARATVNRAGKRRIARYNES
jgi:DNA-binding IclR family transcriptional regulator